MEQKKDNPVEGRLGIPSPTRTEPHAKFTKRNTNYGIERLGITSDAEPKSTEPVLPLSEKQKTPTPHTGADKPITILPVLKEIVRQSESSEPAEIKHHYSISSKPARYKIILGRKKIKTILLLSGIPVIALVLLLWLCLDGGETAPQVAAAIEQSPSDQPVVRHVTRNAAKSPQNSLETAERPTKHGPVTPRKYVTRQPTKSPASPTTEQMQKHPESGQAGPTVTLAKSAFREAFGFLAEMKTKPETTAPVPAKAAPPPRLDEPKKADPKPVVRRIAAIASASNQLGIKLGGIMSGHDGKVAIINNRSVKVGQTVDNAKLVHIGDFSVEVELNGKRYLIGISSSQPKKASDKDEDDKDKSSDSDDDEKESKTENEKKEE